MKITSKTLYAIKFMVNLASTYELRTMSVSEIAGIESISEKFLENIVASLKAKGLVKVKRGAKGGYFLAKSPQRIAMREVIEAVEADRLTFEWDGKENSSIDLALYNLFSELNNSIVNFLESKTLDDLLNQLDALKPNNQMFYI